MRLTLGASHEQWSRMQPQRNPQKVRPGGGGRLSGHKRWVLKKVQTRGSPELGAHFQGQSVYVTTGPAGVCPHPGRGHLTQELPGRQFLPTQSSGGRDWMEGQTCSQNTSNPLSREAGRHPLSRLALATPRQSASISLSGVGGCSHLVLHKKDTVLEENVKEERLCLCICVTEPLCYIPETNMTL